jgi:hypothetical protein
LGYHAIHYALFLSALHEGVLNFLVCLSSYAEKKCTVEKAHFMFYVTNSLQTYGPNSANLWVK